MDYRGGMKDHRGRTTDDRGGIKDPRGDTKYHRRGATVGKGQDGVSGVRNDVTRLATSLTTASRGTLLRSRPSAWRR